MACMRMRELQYLQCFLYLTLISLVLPKVLATTTTSNMSLPGCLDKCGNITIPYPFGISSSCSRDNGFHITCDETNSPKALVSESSTYEIIDINITSGETRVYVDISYLCYNQSNQIKLNNSLPTNISGLPYYFSNIRNKFTVIGCDAIALFFDKQYISGCYSSCPGLNSKTGDKGSCNGTGCCQIPIPLALNCYELHFFPDQNNSAWQSHPCFYPMLVEEDWYSFQLRDLNNSDFLERNKKGVPTVLDWAIRDGGTCQQNGVEDSPKPACISHHGSCYNASNGAGYLCSCSPGYDGNPYVLNGCIDIDECNFPDKYPCHGNCKNTEGSYECSCPRGRSGNATIIGNCTRNDNFPFAAKVVIGIAIFLGLCVLLAASIQRKRHMKEREEYQRYYDMMDNQLRLFTKKHIEIATNNFDESQILGTGGQGKVYKGYLEDNKAVAIKRSKEVEENKKGEFVNEILLLSQINHKNIVRLLGCCMEVKIPILVYEFISNGTLYDLLHGKGKSRPISLGTRLNIALESAEALDYLHSSITRSILHGDVKSANILLEVNYHAKVSDFGASNLVPIDDTQVVKVVQGTHGYIDPEYVATAVLTKKSDVYSFGVVLLELITRKCAIFRDETAEKKHLASCFISNANKSKLHILLDKDIVTNDEKVIEVLQEVSDLAVWCLSVRGEDRPTMRQIAEKLQNLVKFSIDVSRPGPETIHDEAESLLSESISYSTSHTSAHHSISYSSVLEIESRVPR